MILLEQKEVDLVWCEHTLVSAAAGVDDVCMYIYIYVGNALKEKPP